MQVRWEVHVFLHFAHTAPFCPHALAVLPGRQMLPMQHPPHELGVHSHRPATHCWPKPHAAPAPHLHWPPLH
jgi:hypothetical protein